jgi:hypothetical protein
VSGSVVNWLIDVLCCKRLPAIDLAHIDLTGSEQRPEQHCRRICRWQHGLGFDPPLELFVQTLDRIRCSCASPLARRQAAMRRMLRLRLRRASRYRLKASSVGQNDSARRFPQPWTVEEMNDENFVRETGLYFKDGALF